MSNDFVVIGRLGRSHGLKGEFKTRIEEDHLDDFLKAKAIFLIKKGLSTPFFVEYVRGKNNPIIKLEGINNRSDAALLQHADVQMRSEDLSTKVVEENPSSSLENLLSYQIIEKEAGPIGKLEEIIESPQQQLAVVQYQGREIFIPLHEDFIERIDQANQVIYLNLPEGLLSL